jgi:multicomponent Na+:H+ antiporter subunit D
MNPLLPLPVVIPLLMTAAISAFSPLLRRHRRSLDAIAILTSAAVAVLLGVILAQSAHGDIVYWFAGFRPHHNVALGIDFDAEPLSTGLACLTAVLVTASMLFSWRYFEQAGVYYHALMLTFLAGMAGFCLTGDIFDMFVWFELMSVAAYALTAYRPDERGPLQGALNFAITNSVGAFLSLSGIALIYGRTGALNMAQIGHDLAGHRPDGLVVVAFVFISTGLLVKAGIVPFQFWHADAHAVAPTPVCVLFSAVMAELGLYGLTRVYWSMFAAALGHPHVITALLLTLGLLTAVIGALYCFRERHIKRLLAFSTISHAGMFLCGVGLLTPLGLAGAALYVAGHALIKAALFLCTGIVLHRLGSVNETALHGRGRILRVTGVVFTLAALGLADLPPFATFLGKGWVEDSSAAGGHAWIIAILLACSVLVGGAVLRVAGGVFYGLGDPPGEAPQMAAQASEEKSETDRGQRRTPVTMLVPAAVLTLAGLGGTLIPRIGPAMAAAAARFQDQAAGNATVLTGATGLHPVAPAVLGSAGITLASVLLGAGSAAGALLLAGAALYRRRLPVLRGVRPGPGLARLAEQFQSGVVNDYVTWLVLGVAAIGGALALAIR